MNSHVYERVHENLRELKLDAIDAILDTYIRQAMTEKLSVLEILDHLLDEEQKRRHHMHYELALARSGIPFTKTMESFDFAFQPSIDREIINDLKTLRFLHQAENVIILGPPGVGKTHLAIALGLKAIEAGMKVQFLTSSQLIERLLRTYRKGTIGRYITHLTNVDLLIIDEIGYQPFDSDVAHCFFQLICARYEKGSTILTSNKSFSKWGEIFPDEIIATAFLDRLLHHSTTINIKGESYRMKELKENVHMMQYSDSKEKE